ncbi:hypothetical protein EVAR_18053_1 [Eumeta japonica]|uniref:Uncharacterized protein n=1 Tax=Eumeta variegata TaxID=151549 RepID=A0A4C1XSL4_EUMVA|nr:hypothetical protein EVAR_18053_1 [Eumeta japonica]
MYESFGGTLHKSTPPFIRYPIPVQKADNALVTPQRLRVSLAGGDHLPSESARAVDLARGSFQTRGPFTTTESSANGSFMSRALSKYRVGVTSCLCCVCAASELELENISNFQGLAPRRC